MAQPPVEYIAATIPAETIYVSYTTLFNIAEDKLGDALRWVEIAQLNNLTDPWIFQTQAILIPPVLATGTIDGVLGDTGQHSVKIVPEPNVAYPDIPDPEPLPYVNSNGSMITDWAGNVVGENGVINVGAPTLVFSPLEISSIKLWLDASDASSITHSSGCISVWRDKSGNFNHLSQVTPSARPNISVAAQNGLNTVSFVAANSQSMTTTFPISLGAWTVVMVCRRPSGSIEIMGNSADTGTALLEWANDGTLFVYDYLLQKKGMHNIPQADVANYHIMTGMSGLGDQSKDVIFLDEVGISVDFYSADAQTSLFDTLGKSNGTYCNGYIAEFVLYNRILSTSERQTLENYMKNKWGV